MTSAIVAVLAAVLGVVVGSLLTQRREHRTWLRDQRMQAYSDLVALTEYADNIRSDVHDITRLREYQQKHNELLGRLVLVGSQEMATAATQLHRLGTNVYTTTTDDELRDAVQAYGSELLKTAQVARKEFGLPRLKLRRDITMPTAPNDDQNTP